MHAYLVKPWNASELRRRLTEAVAARRVQALSRELTRALNSRARLMASNRAGRKLNHDMRSVITGERPASELLKGSVEMLESDDRQGIIDELHELATTVHDSFVFLESLRRRAEPWQHERPAQVTVYASHLVQAMRPLLPLPAGVSLQIAPVSDVIVTVDQVSVTRIFINLIDNACRAMDDDGAIHVRAAVVAGRLQLDVSDVGPGVPVALRKRVFEMRFTTRAMGVDGGYGLSISRELARAEGGDLELLDTDSGIWPAFAGLALVPIDEASDRRWLATVHQHLHPVARSGAFWRDFSWDVHERSGYFNLSGKAPLDFDHARPDYSAASQRLDAAPWLGIQAVWPSPRGVEATFTFVKIYAHTWFGFQLAKWPGGKDVAAPSRVVLRDLYLRVFEHMQHDLGMRWVAGYLEANVKWNQLAQFTWAERIGTDQAVLWPFRLLEAQTERAGDEADRPRTASGDVEIGGLQPAELPAVAAAIEAQRSPQWCDVLDLNEARMDLAATAELWQAAGCRGTDASELRESMAKWSLPSCLSTARTA